ncbi:CHAT domain-containing protein [Paraburkholderia silviterrae]|uniref:CHAT domain-containing protein n=1 Tax=Paraburkholderia silviterrae TaxID=2528715 RepID=A0A4R5M1H1_9BURK|nr:CHAT domain-containing protein [Paraburkholderia silviterrae]TDG19153.1 CHAT domain-containing protein [Paraburkholderia silviterrae]
MIPLSTQRVLRCRLVLHLATAILLACVVQPSSAQSIVSRDPADAGLPVEVDGRHIAELEARAAASAPEGASDAELCAFYQARGLANYSLGRYPEAISDLSQAAQLSPPTQKVTERCDKWRIRYDLSTAFAASGDIVAQIDYLKRTLAAMPASSLRHQAYFHARLADAYITLGMLHEAGAELQQVKNILSDVRGESSGGFKDLDLAVVYSLEGRLQMVQGNYRAAEDLERQEVDARRRFLAELNDRHTPDSAVVRWHREALTTAERRLVATLVSEGKLGEAAYYARESLAETQALSGPSTVATSAALKQLGVIRLQQGQVDQAAALLEQALQSVQQAQVQPYSLALADRRAWIGLVQVMRENWTEAANTFAVRDADQRRSPEQFAQRGSGNLDWAFALQNSGRPARAEAMLRRMLAWRQRHRFSDPLVTAYIRGYLANALASQHKQDEALEQYRLSFPEMTGLNGSESGGSDSDWPGGFVRQYRLRVVVEGYLDLLANMQASATSKPGIDVANEAFKVADIARNSAVQQAVVASVARANLPDPQLAALARREQDAANRAQSLGHLLEHLTALPTSQIDDATVTALERELHGAAEQQANLSREINARFPGYADLTEPRPASIDEVRRLLRPGEALVAIYVGARQTYVWTLSGERTSFRAVGVARQHWREQVALLRQSVDLSDGRIKPFDVAAAQRLYTLLLGPDADLWASARTLDVIPDGPLGQVPFALLLTEPGDISRPGTRDTYADMPWLIKKLAIEQYPSANGLVALRKAAPVASERRPFVGFGDPVFDVDAPPATTTRGLAVRHLAMAPSQPDPASVAEPAKPASQPAAVLPDASAMPAISRGEVYSHLPALPDTGDELRDMAKAMGADPQRDLFLQRRATVCNVKATDLSQYRVVAFATHSLAAGEVIGLDEPVLAMSNPALVHDGCSNGFLSLDDVFALKLDADWVVLSACDTGSGDGMGNEAVSGLGRAFFYAGARSLLVSNWAVETVSARLLTTRLFRIQAANRGITRAEALRQSMLELMSARGSDYGHPAFWAAFSLVGDGAR